MSGGTTRAVEPGAAPARTAAPPDERAGRSTPSGRHRGAPRWLPLIALAGLGAALYGRGFTVGLVGDDFTLLDAALRAPFLELLSGRYGILGYYRPVSRELYFWLWGRIAGGEPLVFHAVNALVYAAAVGMFYLFVKRWQNRRVAALAALAFVLFPPGGALLSWVSCAQDLIALCWGTAALLLYQSGRRGWAGLAVLLAALSKETAAILAPALVAFEWIAGKPAPTRERWRRLIPVALGIVAAFAIAVAARATWPPGTAVTIWSPRQMTGAWRLPGDFLASFWPPDTVAGIGVALRESPAWIALAVAFAILAVPARGMRERLAARAAGRDQVAAAYGRALAFGGALAVLGMIPVGVILERWRAYFFSFAALGTSLLLGVLLAKIKRWMACVIVGALAIVHFGANSIYRPVAAATGPARHPHVNIAFFRENAELTRSLLAPLVPWCGPMRSMPRVFTLDVPDEAIFQSVLGPALRVTCRDTAARVRPIAEFRIDDARQRFGLLRFDPSTLSFSLESADPAAREVLGERFLLEGRYPQAAALLESAQPKILPGIKVSGNTEQLYWTAIAGAAAGRRDEALAVWPQVPRNAWNAAPAIDILTTRLLASLPIARGDSARREIRPLVAAALPDPTAPAPHVALGRRLIALGATRTGTMELSAAYGISRAPELLVELGEAYERLGASDLARDAYRRALASRAAPELASRARAGLERIGGITESRKVP